MLRMSCDVCVRIFGQETLALQNRLEAIPLILSCQCKMVFPDPSLCIGHSSLISFIVLQ